MGVNIAEKLRYQTDLEVNQLAFQAAMQIFKVTKTFPKEETYSLTDQIRQSSRSVCANLSEAWRRRRYQAAFINNLNYVEAEAAETQVWLSSSKECGYYSDQESNELIQTYNHIIGITIQMIKHHENWVINHKTSRKK